MKRFPLILIPALVAGTCLFAQNVSTGSAESGWNFPPKSELPRIEELPDPFIKPDGTRISSPDEWPEQREYLKAMLEHYLFGTIPPAPTNTVGEVLYTRGAYSGRAIVEIVKITFGPDDRPDTKVSFIAHVIRPNIKERVPVITWNQYKHHNYDGSPIEEDLVCNRHYAIIEFDKEQLAEDSVHALEGPLAQAYPGYGWGCITMWSWGHSRIIDWLETTDFADMDRIVTTGHSRGGKTALCAAIYDERVALCAANACGAGGTGCFRFLGSRLGEGYGLSETAGSTADTFPYWWADAFGEFGERQTNLNHENMATADLKEARKNVDSYKYMEVENEFYLPFDLHYLRLLVAPRALITTESAGLAWYNQFGVQITWIASDEVFQFLGAKGRNALHIREGDHKYNEYDWKVMADFCDNVFFGKPRQTEYLTDPAISDHGNVRGRNADLHFSWHRPAADR